MCGCHSPGEPTQITAYLSSQQMLRRLVQVMAIHTFLAGKQVCCHAEQNLGCHATNKHSGRHPSLPLRASIADFIDVGSHLSFQLVVKWLGPCYPKRVIPVSLPHPYKKLITPEEFCTEWWPLWTSDGHDVIVTCDKIGSNAAFVEFKL